MHLRQYPNVIRSGWDNYVMIFISEIIRNLGERAHWFHAVYRQTMKGSQRRVRLIFVKADT